jgi:Flp pilus assembly protein TadG
MFFAEHRQLAGSTEKCRLPHQSQSMTSRSRMRSHRAKCSRSGVATVEFALIAPIFFLLVIGLMEFGRMVMVQQSLTNAAREGCRRAVLATTVNSSDVESAVRDYLQSVMSNASNTSQVRVTLPSNLANTTSGTNLTVAVEVDYTDVSWLPIAYLGLNPTIGAQQIGKRE